MAEQQLIIDRFYKTIIDSVYDMIFLHDLEGNILDVNQKAFRSMSYSKEELCQMRVFDLHPQDSNKDVYDRKKVKKQWQDCPVGDSVQFELEHVDKNGGRIPVEISAGKVKENGREYFLAFVRDISIRKEKEEKIKYISYHDHLTGLYNRRYFEKELARIDSSMLPLSVIMGDLNGLKIVNNSHGHTTGDKILVKAAEILEASVPEQGMVARYGGDEFIMMLPNLNNRESHQILYQIKERCSRIKAGNFPISIGMGIATMNNLQENINDIIKIADKEMNHNKLLETNSANNKMVKGLLSALGAKSDETVDHTERMTVLARKMGKQLGIHNSELNRLSLLATLHDIGKTSIPASTLNKPGKLNDKEWEMIKGHPSRGYKIASATSEFAVVAEEILSHHERWNGSGYPRGLRAKEIP
ncbi:PAS domain S-box-containing protein/diguanylate cyclase (GGDEF)-like protein [Halanaerobium saccharolyticum]|uniref:PAS domain S-box-containing protein/diguanylate cyclase (GGDEF)-like protein n=1 Tax=Halanaerobium saccharolyticum TaxID=43595 RepID=A0A4R6M221_9FIRM|nr:diguanylate cyclase [Halanaerobium saccharolyticum]TDO95243.1 PAS domain S-box-containing protein/diguanylate cyclase (GGDEF)-like protein [Halanaerobium saccharolyticum]